MPSIDILQTHPEYDDMASFLIAYFGDGWEGRSTAEITESAVAEMAPEFVAGIRDQLYRFLNSDWGAQKKLGYIVSCGIYFDSLDEATTWLEEVRSLLGEQGQS